MTSAHRALNRTLLALPLCLVFAMGCQKSVEDRLAEARLQQELADAIKTRTGYEIDDADQVPAGQLADILAQTLSVPQGMMEEIFAERAVEARAAKVLSAHEVFPAEEEQE